MPSIIRSIFTSLLKLINTLIAKIGMFTQNSRITHNILETGKPLQLTK